MIKGTKVIVRKFKAKDNACAPTARRDEWIDGRGAKDGKDLSIPVDYEIFGILREDVNFNKPLDIDRYVRNGVEVPGHFTTSPIVAMDVTAFGGVICTQNSVYTLVCLFA